MNFFESQLRRLFGDTVLDNLVQRALQMSVINRADGVIDKTLLRFGDYFSRNSRGQTPHICCDSGKHEWYGPPPQTKDWNALRDAASDYVLTFSEDFGMGGM